MSEGWSTIESDPGVMTELLEGLGASGLQVDEVFSLDRESLQQLEPVHGLIFLFKHRPEEADRRQPDTAAAERIYFATQAISNACATQALLSVVLNIPEGGQIDLGEELRSLRDFSAALPPMMRGEALSNSDTIRRVHNSFVRPEPIVEEQRNAHSGEEDDVFHFIAYVPVDGALYELVRLLHSFFSLCLCITPQLIAIRFLTWQDGLKEGPIKLAQLDKNTRWLDMVVPAIQSRIETHAQNEIRFSLMAVTTDKRHEACRRLESLQSERDQLKQRLDGGEGVAGSGGDGERRQLAQIESDISALMQELEQEEQKRYEQRRENVRRKHNYIPFIFNFMKVRLKLLRVFCMEEICNQHLKVRSMQTGAGR
jgi:ubiquitin carboxyl-terminal hydrolase L5